MLAILFLGAGALCIACAWGLARAGRLSTGHGAAWTGIGIVLLLAAVGSRLAGGTDSGRPAVVTLVFVPLLLLLLVGLVHATALSRLEERVRRLAQEIALLRASGPDPAGAIRAEGSAAQPPRPGPGDVRTGAQ
jgi:hypothetical protein